MAFVDQVQDLTSLTASDTDELSQFLKDGVLDVTNRWISIQPQDIELFARESSETTSNASLDLSGAKIISVIREDGVTSNNWRPCRQISSAQQYLVTDTESLSFASKFNPTYMIGDNGKISVFPAPGADPNAFKAYYVNNSPEEADGSALRYTSTSIKYFPDDKVYLVVMYAGIRLLNATMGSSVISLASVPPEVPTLNTVDFSESNSLNITAINPTVISLTAVEYTDAANADASATDVSPIMLSTVSKPDISGDVPTYTKPPRAPQTAFTDYTSGLVETDPGTFSISSIAPVVPALSTTSVSFTQAAPTFTKPSVALDFAQVSTYIDTNEDVELASSKLQEISAQLNEYSSNIQNEQAEFSKESAEYNAQLQISIQNAQLDNQGDERKLQKYQAEIATYQANIGKEVQKYSTQLSQYQLELTTSYQAWAKTESDNIQAYQADIQNEVNEFNKESARYQANIQAELAKHNSDLQKILTQAQLDAADAQQEATQATNIDQFNKAQDQALDLANRAKQLEDDMSNNNSKVAQFQAESQHYATQVNEDVQTYTSQLQVDIQTTQAIVSNNQNLLTKYQTEIAEYQAEVAAETQEQSIKMQQYQLLYNQLKAEYDQAFMIAAPKQQAARGAA